MVSVIMDNLADGLSPEEIVAEYPPLTHEDVLVAISSHEADNHRDKPDGDTISSGSVIRLPRDC